MKFKLRGIATTVVFILMLAVSAGLLVHGNDGENNENRVLSTMPPFTRESAVSGEFASGTEAFVNDRIGFREELIDASRRIADCAGMESPAGTIIRSNMDIGTGEQQTSDILVRGGTITELFKMNYELSDRYADIINGYAAELEESGARVYSAVIPTRLEFEEPLYSNLEDSQSMAIEYINGKLDGKVTPIDMVSALKDHTDEYIYFNTDHHWTMLGAYYGYLAYCAAAGKKTVDIKNYKARKQDKFVGYLTRFAAGEDLGENPDTLEWYDTDENKSVSYFMRSYNEDGTSHEYKTPVFYTERSDYDFFLGADHPLAVYKNKDVKDGGTVLVISDSFVNAFAPWLMETYSTVVLINPRSYYKTLKAAADEFKPDDVLVMNYTFAVTFADYCAALEKLE